PPNGWAKPCTRPCASCPGWASAAVGIRAKARARRRVRMACPRIDREFMQRSPNKSKPARIGTSGRAALIDTGGWMGAHRRRSERLARGGLILLAKLRRREAKRERAKDGARHAQGGPLSLGVGWFLLDRNGGGLAARGSCWPPGPMRVRFPSPRTPL